MRQTYSQGQIVDSDSTFGICDTNGVEYTGISIQLKQGDIFPPTEKDGQLYFILD
ncbi:MAG: hypothetical protein LBK70_00525 [Clostridiales bacterium]|nr:hypothetical protein [Clostridiales bacterium]